MLEVISIKILHENLNLKRYKVKKKKAIIWGWQYNDMKESWSKQMCWVINALKKNGFEVKKKDLLCEGSDIKEYDFKIDNPADICVYNHTDISQMTGNVIKTKLNLFFKPTVPDEFHTTLDAIGYGPFSSISFDKPLFEKENIKDFFETKVAGWIDTKMNKWNEKYDDLEIPYENYYLVLGQCFGDAVNTRHDFGDYYTKLKQVIGEVARVTNDIIVVKLHPHTDGLHAKDTKFSNKVKKELELISPKVKVFIGKTNLHHFIEKSKCVILGNSGAGFEAMMHHKPIISWGKPEYHWITYDLRYLADMIRAVELDWFDKDKQDKFLYWYMEKYCFYNQETCNRRVKELCAKLAK